MSEREDTLRFRNRAVKICEDYASQVRERMDNPKARWRNFDLAALTARIEAAEELAKRIRRMTP